MKRRYARTPPKSDAHRMVHIMHTRLMALGEGRAWLSRRSGVSRSSIHKYWNGTATPTMPMLDLMFEVLGMELDFRLLNTKLRDVI